MASTSTEAAATKSLLTPATTLKGHEKWTRSISYFPDGQRIISGSEDKTARQWNLKAGREIEEARGIREKEVYAVAVSRDGRWIVTGGGDYESGELKACEVKTGIVKTSEGHPGKINCIDISADSKLLASGSRDRTARVWNLKTGKLVAGPFRTIDCVGAVRFSTDSKKLAVKSWMGKCLQVWDIKKQKLDARIAKFESEESVTLAPIFWTNKNKKILAAFTFTEDDHAKTIYEFDASTLEAVGTPFEGHTRLVKGLALSSDNILLASCSLDNTIKLWAFESRQLLASFDVQNPDALVLSPDSRKLAYTSYDENNKEHKIHICDTPPNVLAQAHTSSRKKSTLNYLLNVRASLIFFYALHHLLPLPRSLSVRTTTQGRSDINSSENSQPLSTTRSSATLPTTFATRLQNILTWWPVRSGHALPPIVDAPLGPGTLRNAAAGFSKFSKALVTQAPQNDLNVISGPSRRQATTLRPEAPQTGVGTEPDMQKQHYEPVLQSLPQELLYVHGEPVLDLSGTSIDADTAFPVRNHEFGDPSPEAMLQNLTAYITKDEDYPAARGGFGEIWKCTYSIDLTLIKVAVKALPVYTADQLAAENSKNTKRIKRELRICANLKHKNILPVYGYANGFGPIIAIVSPWAENGNLSSYLKGEGADLTLVRRFQILRDIIAGLRYLHANSVIHGDFNGVISNILVNFSLIEM